MNDKIVIIEDDKTILEILAKVFTTISVVNLLIEDRDTYDSVLVVPIEDNGIEYIELREMITGLEANIDVPTLFTNMIAEAVVSSSLDTFKYYAPIEPTTALLKNGINEMLLFSLVIDNTYDADSKDIIDGLKENINHNFMKAVESVTNSLIENHILGNYSYVEFKQYMPGGIAIFCSNKKMKVLEER